jgi:hypothetical protein
MPLRGTTKHENIPLSPALLLRGGRARVGVNAIFVLKLLSCPPIKSGRDEERDWPKVYHKLLVSKSNLRLTGLFLSASGKKY